MDVNTDLVGQVVVIDKKGDAEDLHKGAIRAVFLVSDHSLMYVVEVLNDDCGKLIVLKNLELRLVHGQFHITIATMIKQIRKCRES